MDLEGLVAKFGEQGSDQTPPEVLLEYAQQIQNFFAGSPDPSKLDYYFGLAFPHSKTEGLLGFLNQKLGARPFDKVKEAVFNLIQFVVLQKGWKSDADRFYIGFKSIADFYWKHSKETARLQQAALDCLISLFSNFGTSLDLVEFEASQLYLALLTRSEKSVYQPTVRGKMFHLMGILGSLGHNTFMKQPNWFSQLFKHLTSTVKAQVESSDSHLEVSILHGCIKGLDRILTVFSTEMNIGDAAWLKFQEHLQKIVDPALSIVKGDSKNVIKRREFQRAALELVANHGELIQAGLFKKYRLWFEDLILWAKSTNADDNRIGRKAMYKFLEMIILEYPNQFKSNPNEKQRAELEAFFQYFADKFKSVLNTKNANKIELMIAVRGFGMLSNLCTEQKQCCEILDLIMVHVDSIIHELESPVVDKYSGTTSTLPTYLESVASILPALKTENNTSEIPEKHLESIKKMVILLIRFYPDLHEAQRQYAHIPVQKIFDSLWNDHHLLCEPFIEQVYQQSLLHIVSCPTRAEIDILIESWNKSHPESKKSALSQLGLKPVYAYLRFWKLLLSREQSGPDELQFDLLMQWILSTIGKLDLTIRFEDSDTSETNLDPVQGATAAVVKDFQIFVNVVDFYHELMSGQQVLHEKFNKWIVPFSYEILGYIKTNVFVSGFYKILAVVFDAARNLRYFEETANVQVQNLQEKLSIFFQGLGTKIQEFRDDLLFSVLELWLSLPDTLILTNFAALNHTLKTVFITGRSSFPLAIKGLEAVERWCFQKDFPVEEITAIMNTIFPILKTFFITSENVELEETASASDASKKGNLKTLIKKNVQSKKYTSDPTLKTTQLKILQLIGSFGQFIHLEEKEHLGLSKDQRFLQYAVPFQDCKPELHIDDLLPRVLELCEHSVERQTRISACEFFHTITLIFIGKSREGDKEKLFRLIFHSILKLGVDSDIVVRQLFNPLALQMIHWFSKRNSPYGSALMDVLTDNLTQYEDLNRREFAALCFGEYFLWSIKHHDSYGTDTKTKSILKTIFAMSTHASPNYRQGSVMAFNSIYKDFREDTTLTSEFSFNLLFSFLTSLKLSKTLPEDCLLITSTKQAIKHLERIFTKKKDRFNTALRRHFKPAASTTETPCLRDVLNWLISEAGSEAKVYRLECLRLIELLCPLTKGIGTVDKFLSVIEEKDGMDGWIQIAEGDAGRVISENESGLVSFLDSSSTVYEFLYKHSMLSKAILSKNSRSTFWDKLVTICTKTPPQSLHEQEKLQLLGIFSRLRFAWDCLDDERLATLWNYSMELSKIVASLDSLEVTGRLIKVWCSGKLSLQCGNLLLMEPAEDVTLVNDDQIASLLKESVWYREMAEGGITSRILSDQQAEQLRMMLWNSVSSSLFKETTVATGSGIGWEAKSLSQNKRKLVENYLVKALCLDIDSEVIVDAAFDASSVSYMDGTFQLVETKGNILQKQLLGALVYCKKLFEFDVLLREKPIKDVGEFIQRLLNLMKSNRILRKLFGDRVFRQTLANWKMISINCDFGTAVKIFVGLLAINIDTCRNSEELSSWWSGPKLMQAPHLDLKQKAEVFGYVTVFAASRKKKTIEAIIKTIVHVVDTALKPEQNWADVEQYVTHILRKILKVFEQLPRNTDILRPILLMIVKVADWLQNNIDHALLRMARDSVEHVVKSTCETDGERVSLASDIYQLITSVESGNKVFMESSAVWKSILLPAVSVLNLTATKNFFKKHIFDIITKMEAQPTNNYEWMTRTLSVHLLELLVYQTSAEFVKGKELADAYVRNASAEVAATLQAKTDEEKVKIVYRSLIKVCLHGITKSDRTPNDDTNLRQCILNCHEACYNTLVATLLVTKGEYKFFNSFLFCGRLLFERLVDDNISYEFPVFIDEASHKLGITSNKKRTKKSSNLLLPDDAAINLLPASGNLSGSSLAPEATSYDFTTSVTVANSEFYKRIFDNPGSDAGNATSQTSGKSDGDKLEWNEINKHGCMFAFVEVLKQMREFHREAKEGEMQEWVKTLTIILDDPRGNIHKNVKTFIVGGIINAPEAVEPFASDLVEPIAKLILQDCFGSVKLNHFVQDVIITLLSWIKTPGARPQDESVTKILQYIVEGVKSEEISKRRDVLNHVLEILQNVTRYWAEGQDNVTLIPAAEIFRLGPTNHTDDSCSLRLNVCLSVLLGGQLPHSNVTELMKGLTKSTTSKYKGVYVTAAKCIGRLLRKVEEEANEFLEEHATAIATKLASNSRTKPPVFVETLTAVQKYFPEIMTRLRGSIMELFQFPKVRSELLTLLPLLLKQQLTEVQNGSLSLSMSPSSPNPVDDFFTDIRSRGLFNQSCKTDGELDSALRLFALLIENCAQPSKLLEMVDWLKSAESCQNSKIKTQFADCLAKLYERLLTEAIQTGVQMDLSIKQSFLKIFIGMYGDDTEEVRAVVNRFWANVLQGWDQSADLMLELLDLIGQEEHPLNVFLGLMLQRCALAPDHSKHIFQEPLENCQFVPFQLDTSWRLRHSTFQPLFAESLSSVQNFSILPRAIQSSLFSQRRSVGKFGMNVLRATLANLQFTPTQNQLPGDTMQDFMMEVDQDNFQFDSFNAVPRPIGESDNGANSNDNQGDGNSPAAIGSTILKLRKKFYAQKDSTFYATRGTEIRTERLEEAKDLERARVSGVKTVRSYRIGELPDILIRHSDMLNTLLKLAKQDENFGRHFLMLLFQGMVTEMQSDQRRIRKFMSKAKEVFDRVFRNTSTSPDRALTTFLMELSIINSITLPTTIVLDMCKICNLQALGILKLEQELLEEGDSSTNQSSKRRRQTCQSQLGEDVWLGLAELYKEIEEYDVHRNIFANVENSTTSDLRKTMYRNIGDALHLEGTGHLLQAVDMYDTILNENSDEEISNTGKMFLEDSLMNCVAELGDWDNLYQLTTKCNTAVTDNIFQNREYVERLIPMKMLSGMQLTLRHDDENPEENLADFHTFIESNLTTEEGTSFLTSSYPFDIGVWLLIENEEEFGPQASLMVDRGYEDIIKQLKNADSLPLTVQRHLIMSLQQSTILCDFRNWRKHGSTLSSLERPTQRLLANWSKFVTHQPFDLKGNNLIASYRDCFLSKIGVTLQEAGAEESLLMPIQRQRVDQEIWLANLGALHKSFSVSRNCLARLKETGKEDIKPIEFRKSLAMFLTVFAKMLEPDDWCKRWRSVWKKLDKVEEDTEVKSIKADLLCSLAENIKSCVTEEYNFAAIVNTLGGDSSATLNACLLDKAQSLMPQSADDNTSKQISSLYNQLFFLLKKLVDMSGSVDKDIAEEMFRCILRACTEQGDADQMLQMSHIFPMLKQFPNLNQTFEQLASSVPSFLFLPWIDQIITSLKSFPQEYVCFNNLITRLVKDFPQAFQLQYPEYLDTSCQLFGKALKAVVLPYKMHENMIGNILYEKEDEKRVSLLYEFQATLQEIINNSNTFYGEYHTEYASEMFEIVNRVLQEMAKSSQSSDSSGSHNGVSSQSWSKAKREMQEVASNHSRKVQRQRTINLEKLSPFLAKFHFFEHASFEKPGLYENFKKPNVQEHPLIVSFHPTVLYYSSLTRPIKFTVITNNGKRSNFLSKLGDDLRQDRRIQQLFKMSNVLFHKDVALKKRNVSLCTYSCIPITSDFGLIEMIDNVMSLVELIFDTPDLQTKRGTVMRKYETWLKANCNPEHKTSQVYEYYRSAAKNVGREKSEEVYTQLVEELPKYVLRDHIKKRSSNLQEFFSVRQSLVKSYGAMSMVHWLLGIGDRHLDNCLLSMNSGNLVGIDFGRAFGTSNYVIPIPEMIPFRLTPQLQQMMMPYSHKGVFRESCILTWNCMVDASEVILTVASVFIQEPSLDWLKFREGSKAVQEKEKDNLDNESAMEVVSDQDFFQFEILKRKLLNHNPTHLLLDELKMHSKKDVPAIYCKIVQDGRILKEKTIVSREEYVDILLDLATDKNILSRIFSGWNAWF